MSSKFPRRRDPRLGHVGRLVRGVLALGAVFLVAFVLTRGNPNAGLFLFLAVVCLGLALVSVFARSLTRSGGNILDRAGGSERDLAIGGLLLVALLTPWSVAVATLSWRQTFGWQSPLPLVVVAAVILSRVRRSHRDATLAIVVAGLGLAAWFGWVSVQLLTPTFRSTGFPFLPIDLVGEGWYVALLAFAVSVDGLAVDASDDDRPARPGDVWPWAIVPGMGLTRLHYPGRGRLWLAAGAFFVFLVQANAIAPAEFQLSGSTGTLPEPHPRGAVLIPLVVGTLVWLASLWDTRQKLRVERTADPGLTVVTRT
jgi:hypothetical protein